MENLAGMAASPRFSTFKIPTSSTIFISADKLIRNTQTWKIFQTLHHLLALSLYLLLQIIRFFLSRFPNLTPSTAVISRKQPALKPAPNGDSGIARALSQILAITNEIPVSSRKYELLRDLAEKLIEENMRSESGKMKAINRSVLSAGFGRTISMLESYLLKRVEGPCDRLLKRVFQIIPVYFHGDRLNVNNEGNREVESVEKFGMELLWLAQKLAAVGAADEAVQRWCAASSLAWSSLSADARVQGSLVKVSAFLLKKMRECDNEGREDEEEDDEGKRSSERMKILILWLPLLCHASNGVEAPVLSRNEREELERDLEDAIEKLDIDGQEKVLTLWLQHFTSSSATDWPNLQTCYTRWCAEARKLMLLD